MNLVEEAKNALFNNGSFQSEVRKLCAAREGATLIAEAMSEFKTWAEDNYVDGDSKKRKQVNNVCNDASRICREEIGMTVVCTTRGKGGVWTYEAKMAPPPKPRAKSTPVLTDEHHKAWVRTHTCTAMCEIMSFLSAEDFMELIKTAKELIDI